MPTLRERTRTSSAAIRGTSTSSTTARRGSAKTRAFILSSSLRDQHLDLVGRARGEVGEGLGRPVEIDATRHHALDGQVAGGDLRRDAVEVVDPVAPGADDGDLLEAPGHRVD